MLRCLVSRIKRTAVLRNSSILPETLYRMATGSSVVEMTTVSNEENGPENKHFRKEVTIGTHNGIFHCDEVLACCLLQHLPEYANASIVRSRDPDELKKCDIVVDVGGVYDPSTHRYDHHQRSFNHNMHSLNEKYSWVTKLSSAGLVYFHFGHKIISSILSYEEDAEKTQILFRKVYENFIEEIDALDNGISAYDGGNPRYQISTHLSSRVKLLNPPWNKPDMLENDCFENAKKVVNENFLLVLKSYNEVWMPAREIVLSAVQKRHLIHPCGEIIELSNGGCPWKEHLSEIEEELEVLPNIKFVLYTDSNGNWRVQCVPISPKSFENRLGLKEEWRGIREEELSQISGIPGCIFVHANGFIGGNRTRDGALQMAADTLNILD